MKDKKNPTAFSLEKSLFFQNPASKQMRMVAVCPISLLVCKALVKQDEVGIQK